MPWFVGIILALTSPATTIADQIVLGETTAKIAEEPVQQLCGNFQLINNRLQERYGETPMIWGLMEGNSMTVFYGNRKTGTWTVIHRYTDFDQACLQSGGKSWGEKNRE